MVLAVYAPDLARRLHLRLGQIQDSIHSCLRNYALHFQSHSIRGAHLASAKHMIETILWTDSGVVMIDQTRLPREEVYVTCTDHLQVADAIRTMVIRGAPAIGVAAAMGIALGMRNAQSTAEFDGICEALRSTRPTAVNLFWAIERMRRVFAESSALTLAEISERLIAEAVHIRLEDIAINQCIGKNGA